MAQYIFGAGVAWATPLTDAYGNTVTNGTPLQLCVAQEITQEDSFETKKLYGQNQFPVDAGRGKGSLSVKAKFAQVNGLTVSSLYYGQTLSTGLDGRVFDVAGAVIPGTPFQITPAVPNSGTWSADMGVRDDQNRPLTRVASAPATGQYSVSGGGAYTFAAADTGKRVYISFAYTATAVQAPGSTRMTVLNLPMGAAPTCRLDVWFTKNGKQFCTTYPNATATKMGWGSKQDDYMIPEIEFECMSDAAGNVMYRSFSE